MAPGIWWSWCCKVMILCALCYVFGALQIAPMLKGETCSCTVQQQVTGLSCWMFKGLLVNPATTGGTVILSFPASGPCTWWATEHNIWAQNACSYWYGPWGAWPTPNGMRPGGYSNHYELQTILYIFGKPFLFPPLRILKSWGKSGLQRRLFFFCTEARVGTQMA